MATMLTEAQTKQIIRETVRETFLGLGIDTSDSDSTLAYQRDQHFLRDERLRKEAMGRRAWTKLVEMAVSAGVAVVVLLLLQRQIP